MSRFVTILLSFDDPECGGAADALVSHIERDIPPQLATLSVKPISVLASASHRDALYHTLQDLFNVRPRDLFVISLLKDSDPDEFRKIKELCATAKSSPLEHRVVTHLGNYTDVGLVIRNLVRTVTSVIASTEESVVGASSGRSTSG